MNEHQITSKHNVRLGTDSLDLITNISQENKKASITASTNISVVPPLNTVVTQQREIHTQTQVQEYERKSTMSRRVINETTLRIYVPRNPDAVSTLRNISTTSPSHSKSATLLSQDEAIATLGLPRFLLAHSPSIHTMPTQVIFCLNLLIFQSKVLYRD